ncbi:MAG: NAD-dependent epimerase/dehydratase family protein [Lacisediminihabitans sp.]
MSSTSRRAVILGGTGAIGGATAQRLAERGWSVDVTGRDSSGMPAELVELGVRFHAVDRTDTAGVSRLIGDGADLLVDLVAYTGVDVEALMPAMRNTTSIVIASSRAVYTDPAGNHINGDTPPRFPIPIPESNSTLAPADDGTVPFSREDYAPCKASVERAALKSGLAVTIIRPSKVHGRWARNARTQSIVEQMLSGVKKIELANRGESVDHLTAAANAAALIETVADSPGTRILNIADPDALTATDIVAAIGDALGWTGNLVGLEPGVLGGKHPWNATYPIILDTRAATRLGYTAVAPGRALIAEEALWVASQFGQVLR